MPTASSSDRGERSRTALSLADRTRPKRARFVTNRKTWSAWKEPIRFSG